MLLIISVKLYNLFPFLCEHFSDDSRYYTTSGMSLVITAPTSTATLSPTVSLPIIFAPQNKTTLSPTGFCSQPSHTSFLLSRLNKRCSSARFSLQICLLFQILLYE